MKGERVLSVIDKGTPISILEGYVDQNSEYVTHHKFAWGSSIIYSDSLVQKVRMLLEHDISPYCGGTLFELAFKRNELDFFRSFLKRNELSLVEVSSGSTDISVEEVREEVKRFSEDLTVIVEVGKKDQDQSEMMYPELWISEIESALEAGASHVILEGRESGTSGIFRPNGEIRKGLLLEIARHIPLDRLIFECTRKDDQISLMNHFGVSIGFGNIAIEDVASLVALQRGLRGDTVEWCQDLNWGD